MLKRLVFLMIAVLLLLAACGSKTESEYLTVDIDQVQQLQDEGAIILDVREVDEFAEGRIIGAVNLPLSEIQEGSRDGLNKDKSYVVICKSGNRSIEASNILVKDDYDLVNVSEGMSSWTGEIEK